MSSAEYAQPLWIDLKPSRLLAGAVASLHCGALLMIPLLPFSAWLVAMLMLVVVISSLHALAVPLPGLRNTTIVAVQWRSDGTWRLRSRDGEEREARLLADSYVHPWLTVLNFRVTGAMRCTGILHPILLASIPDRLNRLAEKSGFVCGSRCSVVLLPDRLERERFRLLRVRLRLEGTSAVGSGLK